jgi:cytoskeletal protein CcmA (bactofilin family)
MFKREETSAPAPRGGGPTSTTVIGNGTSLNGVLRVNGALRVDGEVEGQIIVSQALTVGASGVIKADVATDSASIGGLIRGRVRARGKVVLLRGARLEGDVHANTFQIEDGAFFQGNCTMGEQAAGAEPAGGGRTDAGGAGPRGPSPARPGG